MAVNIPMEPMVENWFNTTVFRYGILRERPLDSQGGAWVFLEKNILALVLAKKNILALTMCEKNILAPSIEKKMSALYPWKENVCPL